MFKDTIITTFQSLLSNKDALMLLPIEIDNKIKIRNYEIIFEDGQYFIYELKKGKLCDFTWTKSAALALVKNYISNKKCDHKIKDLDYIIVKNSNDAYFYKNTIKGTRNHIARFSCQNRLDVARMDILNARKELHAIIFD